MTIPNLKRVKISSDQELRNWLAHNPDHVGQVMVTTVVNPASPKFVSREQVQAALVEHGWVAEQSYTLNGGLLGQVIGKI